MQDRDLFDVNTARRNVYDATLQAVSSIKPVETDDYVLQLQDVSYDDKDDDDKYPEKYESQRLKEAIYGKQTVGRRLRGTWVLVDKKTGKPIATKRSLLAVVPRLNEDGTMIYRGSRYAIMNQTRVKPGIFTRQKKSGELEAYTNVKPGTGMNHRYVMDPKTGVYYLQWKQSRIPLSEVLPVLGVTPQDMEKAWGKDIAKANLAKRDPKALNKLYQTIVPPHLQDANADDATKTWQVRQEFEKMELDPWSTERTLKMPAERLSGPVILRATQKILNVSKKVEDPDDRDHLAFQTFHAVEDTIAERIARDKDRVQRKWLKKAAREGSLDKLPNRLLQPQIEAAILSSGLGVSPDYANPLDAYERAMRVSKLGEGGIPSTDATPMESRDVHPSQHLFIDGTQTPESLKIGADSTMTWDVRRGKDGKIYVPLINAKTGRREYLSPEQMMDVTVAMSTPGAEVEGLVGALQGGKETFVKPSEVQYIVDKPDSRLFSPTASLIALRSSMAPHRLAMGSRMLSQAVPLVDPDPFLVRSARTDPQGRRVDTVQEMGSRLGVVKADIEGMVTKVTPDFIEIKTRDGKRVRKPLYNHFPMGSKTFLHNIPTVQPGTPVKPGSILAKSNLTTDAGEMAVSKNARIAFMPWGDNFEDTFVVSESFAKKLSSQHLYRSRLDADPSIVRNKQKYLAALPAQYTKEQLANIDDDGVVKPGTVVKKGDPLILATSLKYGDDGRIHRRGKKTVTDASIAWEHDEPGEVVDIFRDKKGNVVVAAKVISTLKEGDKIASLFGDKGVVKILPDAEMPTDEEGNPVDIAASDLGVISRENPARLHHAWLGKIAAKTGKPYVLDDFADEDHSEFVERELAKHGIPAKETLTNPKTGAKVEGVAVGVLPILKLHHLSESKAHARSLGRYTSEGAPAKGSDEDAQAKRLSNQELHALIAHGADEFIKEGRLLRGQQNTEYWSRYLAGHNPPEPKVPFVYEKYLSYLRGMGLDPVQEGSKTSIFLMSDRDVKDLTHSRVLKNAETLNFVKNQTPISGGLFDPELFGDDGMRWARIELPEPLPHPLMEEPIRVLMGVSKAEYRDIMTGKKDFGEFGRGPQAVNKFLESLDLKSELRKAAAGARDPRVTKRDAAIKKLKYLRGLYDREIDPKDLIVKSVPVIPARMRPIAVLQSTGAPVIDGLNLLYRDLMETVDAHKELKKLKADSPETAFTIYEAAQAVYGLRQPLDPALRQKKVGGVLQKLVGPGSPKYNFVNRKLLSSPVDFVARAVALPNAKLKLDEIAIPEEQAWDLYRVPVIRQLRRRGFPLEKAVEMIDKREPEARQEMLAAMAKHPVVASRAPVLHKYGIMAFKPKLTAGHSLQLNPLIHEGFNLDHDGDTMNFHVVLRDESIKEAEEKLLPSRSLKSPRDFKTPVFVPRQDHALGLYLASNPPDDKKKKQKRPVIFRSVEDVRKALLKGEIKPDTPVKVLS